MNKINKCDNCNNAYAHRQSLWRHKQSCNNKRIRQDAASYPSYDEEKHTKKSKNSHDLSYINLMQSRRKVIDHNELSGNKPLSRNTLHHLMDILKINMENREPIIRELLMENRQKRANGEWEMENILLIDRIKRAMVSRKLNKDDLFKYLINKFLLLSDPIIILSASQR